MTLKQYFKKANKEKWAIGQFNFSTIEQLRGIFSAASKLKSPIILGTSEGESGYLGLRETVALVEILKTEYQVPAFLNLDHGKSFDLIKKAIDYGYSAIHYDGSSFPFKENVKQTKKVVDYARGKNIVIEGELGYLRGSSQLHKKSIKIEEKDMTSVEEAKKFVKETGVDSLAVVIGNVHGVYAEMPKLNLKRLEEINNKVKENIVLHGGSGISNQEIKKSIKLGVVKVNNNTELRIAWKEALEKTLKENPSLFKPYKILPNAQLAVQKKVEEKIKLFGSQNKI